MNDASFAEPPKRFDLPAFVEGETWEGITLIGPVTINGQPPAHPLSLAVLSFRRAYSDIQPKYVLSTAPAEGQGSITIVDAATWRITVPRQALPLRAGMRLPRRWFWHLDLVDNQATKKTYVGGAILVTPQL